MQKHGAKDTLQAYSSPLTSLKKKKALRTRAPYWTVKGDRDKKTIKILEYEGAVFAEI